MDLELCKTQSPLQLLHITSPVEVSSKIYEDATSKVLVRLAQIPVFPRDLYIYPIQRLFNIPKQICYMDTLEKKPGPYASIFPPQFAPAAPKLELFVLIFLQSTELRAGTKTAMSSGPTRRFSAQPALDWHLIRLHLSALLRYRFNVLGFDWKWKIRGWDCKQGFG